MIKYANVGDVIYLFYGGHIYKSTVIGFNQDINAYISNIENGRGVSICIENGWGNENIKDGCVTYRDFNVLFSTLEDAKKFAIDAYKKNILYYNDVIKRMEKQIEEWGK